MEILNAMYLPNIVHGEGNAIQTHVAYDALFNIIIYDIIIIEYVI